MRPRIHEAKSGDLPEAERPIALRVRGRDAQDMAPARPNAENRVGRSFLLSGSFFRERRVVRQYGFRDAGRCEAETSREAAHRRGAEHAEGAQRACAEASSRSRAAGLPNRLNVVRAGMHVAAVLTVLCTSCLIPACVSTKSAPEATREFTDEIGRTLKVKPNPKRIVSLAPSITETLFALGLEDRIVGVTSFCDYPAEAKQKESIGDTLKPNIERIIALKPDLVIVSTASQLEQIVRRLDELRIPVYVSSPRNLEGTLDSIDRLGEISGVADRAHKLTAELRSRIDAVRARVAARPPPPVFFILGSEPLITAGGPSFINDLIARAGGRSISADETADYPQFSLETAVARRPEVIFLQAGEGDLPERLNQTPAARAGRVYRLDDALLLRPGPRIVDGLEHMAARIHPE